LTCSVCVFSSRRLSPASEPTSPSHEPCSAVDQQHRVTRGDRPPSGLSTYTRTETRDVTDQAEIRYGWIRISHLTSARIQMRIYHANYLQTVLTNKSSSAQLSRFKFQPTHLCRLFYILSLVFNAAGSRLPFRALLQGQAGTQKHLTISYRKTQFEFNQKLSLNIRLIPMSENSRVSTTIEFKF